MQLPTNKGNSQVDLDPIVLAAQLIETGEANLGHLRIHTSDRNHSNQLFEVVHVRRGPKNQDLIITVKGKEGSVASSDPSLNSDYAMVIESLLQEIHRVCIDEELEKRRHQLGVSPMLSNFLELPVGLTTEEQRLLCYYLPYASLIRGDIFLMTRCLRSVLGSTVALEFMEPKLESIHGARVNELYTGWQNRVGGQKKSSHPCLKIRVGPVAGQSLDSLIPGGRKRAFLEQHLIPLILPRQWDWVIQILPMQRKQFLLVGPASEGHSRLEISSTVK